MAKPYVRIGFIRTVQYESEGRRKGPMFNEGEVFDCARDFGERWLSRNVAVELPGAKDPGDERWVKVEDSGWTVEKAQAAAEADADAHPAPGSQPAKPAPAAAAKPAPAKPATAPAKTADADKP